MNTSTLHPLLPRACRGFLYSVLLLSAFCQGAGAQTAGGVAARSPGELQELPAITITGRYAGPPLWKVSKGDHVLWIFPYLSLQPGGLEWDSAQVAQALAESQEYLPLPRFDSGSIPRRVLLNPEGQTLGDVLPPALYERYLALKAEYFPRNRSLERLRPLVAGPSLVSGMYRRSGLTEGGSILRKIDSLARRNRGLKRTAISNGVDNDLVARMYAERRDAIPPEQEFACFEKSLTRVRTDVNALIRRANAWAEGNMEALRETFAVLDTQSADNSCAFNPVTDQASGDEMAAALTLHLNQWVEAAEAALTNNVSTVAVFDAKMLLETNGILTLFRNKGYIVREPD
jgi:hypothetical protein